MIGLGTFGETIARVLAAADHEVLAIDKSESQVQKMADVVEQAVKADAKNRPVLEKLELGKYDAVVVGMTENIEANVFVNLILKDLGVKYIISKAQNRLHGEILERIGVDKIVFPESEMGHRIARELIYPSTVLDYIAVSADYSVAEFPAPRKFVGRDLKGLALRQKHDISVLAIKRGEELIVNPRAEFILNERDILFALGKNSVLEKVSSSN